MDQLYLNNKAKKLIHDWWISRGISQTQTYFYNCDRVDIVFDFYLQSILKDDERETSGVGPSMIVRGKRDNKSKKLKKLISWKKNQISKVFLNT